GVPRLHGSVPIYSHPNSLGGVSMGAIPYVVFLFPVVRTWLLRIPMLVLAATATTCVLYTGSRTAYVAFFAFGLVWFFMSRRKKRWLIIALVISAVAYPVIPQHYKERFTSITGQEAEGQSKGARTEILRDAWQILLENPAGVGIASFPTVRQQRFGRSQDTHNLYLEVAINLGIQGLVVFLALVACILGACRQAQRRFEDQRKRICDLVMRRDLPPSIRGDLRTHDRDLEFFIAVTQATWGFLFIRLVVGLFGSDLYEIYWWFCAGLAISLLTLAVTTFEKTRFLRAAVEHRGSI
ncbi:MAG: O-antigen ligase family protein, partial [Candidatus Eisenbacteria sp.]|nr:O-antigen ligase family protein [Candidatus Eisenbacteria bacterium]